MITNTVNFYKHDDFKKPIEDINGVSWLTHREATEIANAKRDEEMEKLRAENTELKASAERWARQALENKKECGEAGALLITENTRLALALQNAVSVMSECQAILEEYSPGHRILILNIES